MSIIPHKNIKRFTKTKKSIIILKTFYGYPSRNHYFNSPKITSQITINQLIKIY